MSSNAIPERRDVAAPRPIAELLACPPAVGNMLNASAESLEFDAGDILFQQKISAEGCMCRFPAICCVRRRAWMRG